MTDAELDDELSQPTPVAIEAMRTVGGDLLILGAGGKMGPTLARLAVRATLTAGVTRRVIAVARFSEPGVAARLRAGGVETVRADLFDPGEVSRLPDAPNVIYLVGQKFGTTGQSDRTWAVNAFLPGVVAQRFRGARIVGLSTGNVYPLWPAASAGPTEHDATGPVGEYAQSALARERVLEYFSRQDGTPMAVLRLNYAIEPRYGVLRDIGDRVRSRLPVSVTMGRVNVIWQRDANAIALAALGHCTTPPFVLNVTGAAVSVRAIAERFAERWDRAPVFEGQEAPTALLSNPARCLALFGPLPVGLDEMIAQVASWIEQGGRSLEKPTHFEVRDGGF